VDGLCRLNFFLSAARVPFFSRSFSSHRVTSTLPSSTVESSFSPFITHSRAWFPFFPAPLPPSPLGLPYFVARPSPLRLIFCLSPLRFCRPSFLRLYLADFLAADTKSSPNVVLAIPVLLRTRHHSKFCVFFPAIFANFYEPDSFFFSY